MNKINNTKITYNIIWGLEILIILAFSLIAFIPTETKANFYYYPENNYKPNNPTPIISSIEPNSINGINNKVTITVTGSGFIPSSIVRKNNSNRTTTFIDSNNLIVDIYANDMYNQESFFLTVFNGEPGGGYSNASTFTIKNNIINATTTTNNQTTTSENTDTNNTVTNNDTNENFSNLTANALLGSNSFMPSGLAQWIFLIIIILAIIFLWRYVYAEEEYLAEPMKHS
jgi:hypothetical protein